MTEEDRNVILEFARGNRELKAQAVVIHRKYIPALGVRGTPEQRFMAEVDNVCPDYGLRNVYRDALLDAQKEPDREGSNREEKLKSQSGAQERVPSTSRRRF